MYICILYICWQKNGGGRRRECAECDELRADHNKWIHYLEISKSIYFYTYTHTCIGIYMHIYINIYICVFRTWLAKMWRRAAVVKRGERRVAREAGDVCASGREARTNRASVKREIGHTLRQSRAHPGVNPRGKPPVVGCKIPRKENSPIFQFFFAPPPFLFPGFTRGWLDDWSKQALRIKTIGLIKTVSRVCPKKRRARAG